MQLAARLVMGLALCLALVAASLYQEDAAALEQGKLVAPGRLVVAGRRLSCGTTATLLRDFEGFAVSSTVIMLNMQALKELPRPVQWLIYYHECGHILYGPERNRRRLLCGEARQARGLARQDRARRCLRGVQYRRPRAGAPRSRSPLRAAKAMLRQEKRPYRPRRHQVRHCGNCAGFPPALECNSP